MKHALIANRETINVVLEKPLKNNLTDEFYKHYFYEVNAINDLIENAITHGRFSVEHVSLNGFKVEKDKMLFIDYLKSLGYRVGIIIDHPEIFYISWKQY